ncbi:MAG: hypothetical protein OXC91_15420 [Rhodobacteraceae bacterium]|nr:hypothetical protein [Paracoccaceae bacterium]
MNDNDLTIMTLREARQLEGRTNWEALQQQETAGIEPEKDPDEGEFDWSRAQVSMPRPKQPVSLRLDAES